LTSAAATGSLWAQTGSLDGRVLDARGEAIVGARVELGSSGATLDREQVTDRAGWFRLSQLRPGSYTLAVSAPGFVARTLETTVAVGQSSRLDVTLEVEGVVETVAVAADHLILRAGSSTVDTVIDSAAIERLPLNGRNVLELALLAPGNAPAPGFDPTKSNSVLISSAGQLGRGGMVTIDGADNNDDVVGGPLQNVPQEAVQEFQIATNQYRAEHGRSASSAINVITKSGTEAFAGSFSLFLRDDSFQERPATVDPDDQAPPFDRQHYGAALGGPLGGSSARWFLAAEVRDQDGGVLVGERDAAERRISRTLAPAPLEDVLGVARLDWNATVADQVTVRYAFESADDTTASSLERALGSASQRQQSDNDHDALLGSWMRVLSPTLLNTVHLSWSRFRNAIEPVVGGPQITFPSLQAGTSFRVPQETDQDRLQLVESIALVRGEHGLEAGLEVHRVKARFGLGVFRDGRLDTIQDFPDFDRNGDGRVDDDDILFAVSLRSGFPDRDLIIDDVDNDYYALFVQDDWRVGPSLTLNLGLRWELDSDVKNVSRYDQINPLVRDFLSGDRDRDTDNFGPRLGFAWAPSEGRFVVRGGYGVYFDRVTLQLQSLERGLDGRALPIEVRAGNVFFVDPATGLLPPFAPTLSSPFTGFILPGAGASGINIIDDELENPEVEQSSLGFEVRLPRDFALRVDGLYNEGSNFIIGRSIGEVFNPVVGGPDRVVNLESSVGTRYRALLLLAERRSGRHRVMASYTLARAENYSNDDQIPFGNGPLDPQDLGRERGPSPTDRRHRFTLAASFELPAGVLLSPLVTLSSGVPMDILMPDASMRVPALTRNAGGRRFSSAGELNAFLSDLNARGGVDGVLLPLVSDDAEFNDTFSSVDLRVSRRFALGRGLSLEAILEVFNLLDTTNILGSTNLNYSGYANALVRDSEDPASPGYLTSSSFGKPISTAGGVFGSGGPRALQLGVRVGF
jgi:hypothetical protein